MTRRLFAAIGCVLATSAASAALPAQPVVHVLVQQEATAREASPGPEAQAAVAAPDVGRLPLPKITYGPRAARPIPPQGEGERPVAEAPLEECPPPQSGTGIARVGFTRTGIATVGLADVGSSRRGFSRTGLAPASGRVGLARVGCSTRGLSRTGYTNEFAICEPVRGDR